MYHDLATIELLLQQKPQFLADDHGNTPLDIAKQAKSRYAKRGQPQFIQSKCVAIIDQLEAYQRTSHLQNDS